MNLIARIFFHSFHHFLYYFRIFIFFHHFLINFRNLFFFQFFHHFLVFFHSFHQFLINILINFYLFINLIFIVIVILTSLIYFLILISFIMYWYFTITSYHFHLSINTRLRNRSHPFFLNFQLLNYRLSKYFQPLSYQLYSMSKVWLLLFYTPSILFPIT